MTDKARKEFDRFWREHGSQARSNGMSKKIARARVTAFMEYDKEDGGRGNVKTAINKLKNTNTFTSQAERSAKLREKLLKETLKEKGMYKRGMFNGRDAKGHFTKADITSYYKGNVVRYKVGDKYYEVDVSNSPKEVNVYEITNAVYGQGF